MLTILTAMFGRTVTSTAVLTSTTSATSGVEMIGKPNPSVPCARPARTMIAAAVAIMGAEKSCNVKSTAA